MNKNKFFIFILSFLFSSFAGADCASETEYVVGGTNSQSTISLYNSCVIRVQCETQTSSTSGAAFNTCVLQNQCAQTSGGNITIYNSCISQSQTSLDNPTAPQHPGAPPVNNCGDLQGAVKEQCLATYHANMEAYNQALTAYQLYLQSQGGGTAGTSTGDGTVVSATQVLEDIAAKQQAASDQMKDKSQTLTILGMALIAAGFILLGLPIPNPYGYTLIAAGAVLVVYGLVTGNKSNILAAEKLKTCQQYDKLATKPLYCPTAQPQVIVDGVIPVSTGGSVSSIPYFIDPVTGLCRPGAPVECKTLTKNLPPGCFQKGGACLAGGKVKPQVVAKNGKVTLNVNGKQRTFGLDDFQSESAMVKAGFTPAQAKQFYSDLNNANGILAKNGLNIKGELKGLSSNAMPTSSLNAGSGGAVSAMKIQKDVYGPAVDERTPASAEGLTKDYHGDTIGVDGDDVFKMITRRYSVKRLQNTFIGE